jgi:hypothetical protein
MSPGRLIRLRIGRTEAGDIGLRNRRRRHVAGRLRKSSTDTFELGADPSRGANRLGAAVPPRMLERQRGDLIFVGPTWR